MIRHPLLTHVESLLTAHKYLPQEGTMLCALSGGADSVALVLALLELGYSVDAMHCNFHLRGEESDRDEQFVRDFCATHHVSLHVQHFDTKAEAVRTGESLEMAARRLRYDWFQQVLMLRGPLPIGEGGGRGLRGASICVAHHADDNVETMLLNLIRGAGLHGLTGMAFKNDWGVLRPLLTTTRAEILDFLQSRSQPFVTDSTNADTAFRRNKIRHELLPLLREMNPSIDHTLTETMSHLREAEALLDGAEGNDRFRQRRQLLAQGFTMTQITQIENARNGAYTTAGEYMLTKHGDQLVSGRIPVQMPPTPIEAVRRPRREDEDLRNPQCAVLDADAVRGQLFVRSVQEGDRFRPFGMRGTKLVSDYLTDRKRSRLDKLAALVVCDDNGILWLVGETIDQRAAVTHNTTEVVVVEVKK